MIGFTEALVATVPALKDHFTSVATFFNLLTFICVYIGAGWTIKVQYGILAILAAALVSFYTGAIGSFDATVLLDNLFKSSSDLARGACLPSFSVVPPILFPQRNILRTKHLSTPSSIPAHPRFPPVDLDVEGSSPFGVVSSEARSLALCRALSIVGVQTASTLPPLPQSVHPFAKFPLHTSHAEAIGRSDLDQRDIDGNPTAAAQRRNLGARDGSIVCPSLPHGIADVGSYKARIVLELIVLPQASIGSPPPVGPARISKARCVLMNTRSSSRLEINSDRLNLSMTGPLTSAR